MKKVLGIVIMITILFTIFAIKSFADEIEGEAAPTEEAVAENPAEAAETTEEASEEVKEKEESNINLRNIIIYIALMYIITIGRLIAMGS